MVNPPPPFPASATHQRSGKVPAPRRATLALLFAFAAVPLAAQEPLLVADLARGEEEAGFELDHLKAAGGRLYLSHADPGYGYEPWVSDGTAAGTRRLADLCPGSCSSSPTNFTTLGDRVVFATVEAGGHAAIEAATADGRVERIADDLELLSRFEALGERLYFVARRPGGPGLFYRTDGSATGTEPASELCASGATSCGTFFDLKSQGGKLFYHHDGAFHAYSPLGRERLRELITARQLVPFGNGRLFFGGCGVSAVDCGFYTTDGTVAGTLPLAINGSQASDFVSFAGRLYFRNSFGQIQSTAGVTSSARVESLGSAVKLLGATASHLYYARGNAPNIQLLARSTGGADLLLRTSLDDAGYGGEAGGRIYLHYRKGNLLRLLASDGLPSGTVELAEGGGAGETGAALGGLLYFPFRSGGPESARLWRSDGTPGGTAPLAFTAARPFSSFPTAHRQGGSILLQTAGDHGLWRVDPATLASRQLRPGLHLVASGGAAAYVKDSAATPDNLLALAADDRETLLTTAGTYGHTVADDGRLYFGDTEPGQKLWESDGTADGTRALFDLEPGWLPSCQGGCRPDLPTGITPSGEQVFFIAQGATPDTLALWSWRRGAAAPLSLMPVPGVLDLYPAGGGRVVFAAPGSEPGVHLYMSDGTLAGTRSFFRLPASGSLARGIAAGPLLYFVAEEVNGLLLTSSLWVTDLSAAGTRQLLSGARSITELAASGNRIFFAGRSEAGVEPGFSDGTPAGTRWLDLVPGPAGSGARDLFVIEDRRTVFAAAADDAGNELWISDGTPGGTTRLTDLAPGPDASSPSSFAEVPVAGGSRRLFFSADDGRIGFEPWTLDLDSEARPCPADLLCLQDGRFEVSVAVNDAGGILPGGRVLAQDESGIFRFFSPDNWEMLVKVLDGCSINDAFWLYAAAATDVTYRLKVHDRWSGATRTYDSTGTARPILDSAAFATCGASPQPAAYLPDSTPLPPARLCAGDPQALCLGPAGRYRVRQSWNTADDEGTATAVPYGTAETGLFTFFSPGNWETLVKVLDGCAINGKIWVFAAGTTDVGWTLTVTDSATGVSREYQNPRGQPSRTVADIDAFACP